MTFFDLNIPYLEPTKHPTTTTTALKTTRLKLTVKSMELGYTGVAYNRTIKGVMSESDRCSTPLFPLPSLLRLSPSLSSAAALHRRLLGTPLLPPSASTRASLSAPLNQSAFEQACQASEVDLIAIDFSEKLPFRLKQPMVKAAIGRGVYFEISYFSLIMDAQVRRQMITNAKLLVDWTCGKNLILSSAAPSVTEVRGPYDVANLASLLGLSMERAKAAISKNCRSLIADALRKKQFYKEAIRVEVISSGEELDSKDPRYDGWLNWDPISSGEGDLLLEDMAKSFRTSNKASKTVKAIDFTSVIDSLASSGLQIKDLVLPEKAEIEQPVSSEQLPAAEDTEVPVCDVSKQPDGFDLLLDENQFSLDEDPAKFYASSCENSKISFLSTNALNFVTDSEVITPEEEPKVSNSLRSVHLAYPGTEVRDLQEHVTLLDGTAPKLLKDTDSASACNAAAITGEPTLSMEINSPASQSEECRRSDFMDVRENEVLTKVFTEADTGSKLDNAETFTPFIGIDALASQSEDCMRSNSLDVVEDVVMDEVLTEKDINSRTETVEYLVSSDLSLSRCVLEPEQLSDIRDDSITVANGIPILDSYGAVNYKKDRLVGNHNTLEEATLEEKKQTDNQTGADCPTLDLSVSGKSKVKPRASRRAYSFPFKRLFNPVPFKKKPRKSRNPIRWT
ncbi:hypothetical protein RJ639_043192 [Escallonia herrerae]|uniref:Uncharacterized protein n=1 Tax=Escallonia herrerae TaxID=1293975 RepID=A0AA88WBB6_9ASTE|nr:hypothetical protein RJ639_043192 [Escallonia herrerae]